jgi:hypothetical protein
MADKKISALTGATTPLAGTEVLPIVQSGSTVKVAVSDLTTGRAISATQLTLTTGNLIVANGQGVDFSATPGTGTSELFADYEEGAWTPTIAFSGASTGITYSTQTGLYTKIGRAVYVEAIITLSSKGSSTGDATIRGLPFTIGGTFSPATIRPNTITFVGQTVSYFEPSVAYIVLSQVTELGVVAALTNTNFANTSQIMVSGFYFV